MATIFLAGVAAGITSKAYQEAGEGHRALKRSLADLEKRLVERSSIMAEHFDACEAHVAGLARRAGRQGDAGPAPESEPPPREAARDARPGTAESRVPQEPGRSEEPHSAHGIMARLSAIEDRLSEHAAKLKRVPEVEEIFKAVDARLAASEAVQDSRIAALEARLDEHAAKSHSAPAIGEIFNAIDARLDAREAAQSARFAEFESRLNEQTAKLRDIPSSTQIISAMEQFISKTMQSLEDRVSRHERSVETLQGTVTQTDSLLKQVREMLTSLRSSGDR